MKPFRKHAAIAIDGGGIRGVMITTALEALEQELKKPLGEAFELAAGTSTGSIISAGIALNTNAADMTTLYKTLAPQVFKKTWRYYLWLLANYRYPNDELKRQLETHSQGKTMGDLWTDARKFDLVIVVRDLHETRSRFIKPWKPEYAQMPIATAVLASSAMPTYFPVVEGRYVDGGVGSFGNPCFIAAYEACIVREWKPEETTLISLGTGRLKPGTGLPLHAPDRFTPLQWLSPILDSLLNDANDQQARVVKQSFAGLDLRRFQIETEPIGMDDVSAIDRLIEYGKTFGRMILNDQTDPYLDEPVYRVVDH
jgi:hypothetical protein